MIFSRLLKFLISQMIVFFLCFSTAAAAASDPYNSLIWNRKNHLEKTGKIDTGDWYEWWYYKVIDPEKQEAFFFTFGVINPWDKDRTLAGTKSVVQFGRFKDRELIENNFPVQSFQSRYNDTFVKIGNNTATDKLLEGSVQTKEGQQISWHLEIKKEWSFEAMGWGMHVPDISGIYWYPAQASARMTGWIRYPNKTFEFHNALAYQDRNWGRNFPKWWTWLHSNHFKNSEGTVLSAGGGIPKIFDSAYVFAGLCVGLRYEGKDYIFRTTDADSVKFDIHWGVWKITAENFKGEKIEISAYASPDKFMLLPFQSPQGPIFNDYEALLGEMQVKLYQWSYKSLAWKKIADLETSEAGIEWGSPDPISIFTSDLHLQ